MFAFSFCLSMIRIFDEKRVNKSDVLVLTNEEK